MNAAVNPIIYGLTNEKFRKAFQTTTLSKWLFPEVQKKVPITKRKLTKETDLTNKNKIFWVFSGKN